MSTLLSLTSLTFFMWAWSTHSHIAISWRKQKCARFEILFRVSFTLSYVAQLFYVSLINALLYSNILKYIVMRQIQDSFLCQLYFVLRRSLFLCELDQHPLILHTIGVDSNMPDLRFFLESALLCLTWLTLFMWAWSTPSHIAIYWRKL